MIEMIVAMGLNREIGKDNKLLWNLEDDMKHFVKTTKGKNVVMGRKTFDSLPGGPLKGRHNYVITRGLKHGIIVNQNTSVTYLTYEDFLALNLQDFIVIGGTEIYKLFIANTDIIHCTLVYDVCDEADTFFPIEIDTEFKIVDSESHIADELYFCILKLVAIN